MSKVVGLLSFFAIYYILIEKKRVEYLGKETVWRPWMGCVYLIFVIFLHMLFLFLWGMWPFFTRQTTSCVENWATTDRDVGYQIIAHRR